VKKVAESQKESQTIHLISRGGIMKQRGIFQLFTACVIALFFMAVSSAVSAAEMKQGDASLLAFKTGIKMGCMQKPTIDQAFRSSKASTSQANSTVYVCTEAVCGDITVEFGGVLHDYSPGCGSSISFENVPSGTYYFYAESLDCNTYWENEFAVEEGYDFIVWICPPDGGQCCASGCGENGNYNCDNCSGGCLFNFLTQDKTVLANLRNFRDNVLAKNLIGQKLITLYYHWSPALISLAEKSPTFKKMSRQIVENIGGK